MTEQKSSQEKRQEWSQPVIKGLLIIFVGTLLSNIWFGWVKIDIYDKHLKLVDTNVLWSIILLLLTATLWLLVTTNNLKKLLKEKQPSGVILLPQQKTSTKSKNQINKYIAEYAGLNWIIEENDNNYTVNHNPLCPKHRIILTRNNSPRITERDVYCPYCDDIHFFPKEIDKFHDELQNHVDSIGLKGLKYTKYEK